MMISSLIALLNSVDVDWTCAISLATGGGLGLCYQHGYMWWTGPILSAWLQVVDWVCAVSMSTGGGLGPYCQHGYRW